MTNSAPAASASKFRPLHVILWIGLLAAWILMLLLMNPRGEFPLNDDWAYARAVKTLHDTGRIELPTYWASMTLLGHVLWGWLITIPFGFSFLALRLWNLMPALFGIIGMYVILREAGGSRIAGWVAAAAAAFNAVYAQLSVGFMTDITFFASAIWSAIFLLRSLRNSSQTAFWIGLGLSLFATTIRQHGVFIALAWLIVSLRQRGWSKQALFYALLPLLIHASYLSFHQYWFGAVAGSTSFRESLVVRSVTFEHTGWPKIFKKALGRGATMWIYSGVLMLPLWLYTLLIRGRNRLFNTQHRVMLAMWAVISILIPIMWRFSTPLPINIVYDLGIGPPTLRDVYNLGLPNLPTAPREFWLSITSAGIFGGGLMLARWTRLIPLFFRRTQLAEDILFRNTYSFYTVFGACCLILLIILPFYDRYMLAFLPLLALAAMPMRSEEANFSLSALLPAITTILAIAAFSTAGVHDYFAWNRARWGALEWLTSTQRVSPYDVDGGFEYHGWNTYEPEFQAAEGKSWWWTTDDDYVVAFGSIPGYDEVAAFAYHGWLPPGTRAVYVLHRAADLDQACLIH